MWELICIFIFIQWSNEVVSLIVYYTSVVLRTLLIIYLPTWPTTAAISGVYYLRVCSCALICFALGLVSYTPTLVLPPSWNLNSINKLLASKTLQLHTQLFPLYLLIFIQTCSLGSRDSPRTQISVLKATLLSHPLNWASVLPFHEDLILHLLSLAEVVRRKKETRGTCHDCSLFESQI